VLVVLWLPWPYSCTASFISHSHRVSVSSYPLDLRHVIPSPLLFLPSLGYDSAASVRRVIRRRQWPGSTSPTAAATKSKLRLVRPPWFGASVLHRGEPPSLSLL
jgi:hypothetical protein